MSLGGRGRGGSPRRADGGRLGVQAGVASADGVGPAFARGRLWQCDPVDLWSNDIPLSLRGEVLSCQQSLSSALSGATKVKVRPPISSAPASITWSNPMAGT